MFLLWESLSCFLERVLNFDHVTVLKDPKVPESWNLDSWNHLPNISLQEKSTIHRDLRSDRKNIWVHLKIQSPSQVLYSLIFPIKIAGCFYRPCKSRHLAGHIHQISRVNFLKILCAKQWKPRMVPIIYIYIWVDLTVLPHWNHGFYMGNHPQPWPHYSGFHMISRFPVSETFRHFFEACISMSTGKTKSRVVACSV